MLTRAPQSFANSTAEVQDCHIYNTVVRGIIIESYAALEELQKWTTRLARKRDEKRWIIWFSINIQLTINEWGWVSYEELWRSRRVLSVFAVGSRRIAGIWCLRLSPHVGLLIVRSDPVVETFNCLWPTKAWYQFRSGYQVGPSRLSESHADGERYKVFICINRQLDWNRIPPWKQEDFLRVTDPTCSDMLSRCYKALYVSLIL